MKMYFFIDGYNLLFHETEEPLSLRKSREKLIDQLHQAFSQLHLKGMIVFDGSRRRDEGSGLSYSSPLEIAYAPKGQSADSYIIEKIEFTQHRKAIVVVTNDKGLLRHAKAARAPTLSNQAFLNWLIEKVQTKKTKRRTPKESPQQIERLSQIFEKRLLDDSTDF